MSETVIRLGEYTCIEIGGEQMWPHLLKSMHIL